MSESRGSFTEQKGNKNQADGSFSQQHRKVITVLVDRSNIRAGTRGGSSVVYLAAAESPAGSSIDRPRAVINA